ncbi:N-acetyl sugar amidotransferase [Candidatus Micrarchaeota archaeon]|nr:N-acetyl sugar amidotransferase [Candidatus Micrarchaeota archaeon]
MSLINDILDKQLVQLPSEIKFCKKCVVSNQRPRIVFDEESVCGGCKFRYLKNEAINWGEREQMLQELCNQYRRNDGSFDVVVPGSGGKDSAMVSHVLKHKYKMHPLTVTWAPFEYTPIGYKNFRNFVKAGFVNLMAWPNAKLHRKLSRIAFEVMGDAWQPFAFGQYAYAFHIAQKFDIKLVFFGENGEAEYSGDPRVFNLRGMPFEIWTEQYFKGATIDDLIKVGLEKTKYLTKEDIDEADLIFYRPPKVDKLKKSGIEFHWFAYYHKWIPQENYYYAVENTGFEANPNGRSEGTYSKYASLDDQLDGFHYYLAFIKFGIGRCTSDAAHEVRDGHITREEGVSLVKRYDGEFPREWFKVFLDYLDISEEQFWMTINKFRSPRIWKRVNGEWRLKSAVYDLDGTSKEVPIYASSIPAENKAIANKLYDKSKVYDEE